MRKLLTTLAAALLLAPVATAQNVELLGAGATFQ